MNLWIEGEIILVAHLLLFSEKINILKNHIARLIKGTILGLSDPKSNYSKINYGYDFIDCFFF